MTTITIKNNNRLFTKTSFDTEESLLNYLMEQLYGDETLPPLTKTEINEVKEAKAEWQNNKEGFERVIHE